MEGVIVDFFIKVFSFLDGGWCFLITLILILMLFAVNLTLCLKKSEKGRKRRRGISLIGLSLIIFQAFSLTVAGKGLSLALFNFAVYVLLLTPFFFISRIERVVVTKEQRKAVQKFERLAKGDNVNLDIILDEKCGKEIREEKEKIEDGEGKVKKSVLFSFEKIIKGENDEKVERFEREMIKDDEEAEKSRVIEYSGVKKAIEETLNKSISNEDRKKLLYLDFLIVQAEKGKAKEVVKEEINEGLSALLKIMAGSERDLFEKS